MKFYTSGANAFVDVRDVVHAMIHLTKSNISAERYLCTGTNMVFKDLFIHIARQLKVSPPKYLANRFMCEIAWRLASLIVVFTSKKATLTKESVESAQNKVVYDCSKIKETLNMEFRDIDETIAFTIAGKL
jgi:nucleoside-diphosphate-sugar epimerase